MNPNQKHSFQYDLVVIGAGPGGYVAAIRAAQLGLKTAIVERDRPGGVCLNVGCIPSKALIHHATVYRESAELEKFGIELKRDNFNYRKVFEASRAAAEKLSKGVSYLCKKNKIEMIASEAKISSVHEVTLSDGRRLTAANILIATGSRPRALTGFAFDETSVLTSTGALMLEKLPHSVLILGSGAIGMEFAYIWSSFGVKVTVVEMMDRLLPLEDEENVKILQKSLEAQGVTFYVKTRAKAMEKSSSDDTLALLCDQGGRELTLKAQKLLIAVGREPNSENLGLFEQGIKTERGFIATTDYYQTSCPSIYAIGDVISSPLLAHVASKEGEIAVEHMAGRATHKTIDPMLIPSATYTQPQVASFGLTLSMAKMRNIPAKEAEFPYSAIGKAVATDSATGRVKVVFDEATSEILGAHIVGNSATELIHEILLAKKGELLLSDVAEMMHAHPTLAEGVMEAARAGEGWAIHI